MTHLAVVANSRTKCNSSATYVETIHPLELSSRTSSRCSATRHCHITDGTEPVTDLADSRRDLTPMAQIIERMKEVAGR
jgi:hypothetical protein